MPTYTDRGFPLYGSTESMPAWHTGYNAHSTALETALDTAETADHDADWVATIAGLPVTGNWEGRLIWVEEDDRIRRWDGAGWGVIGFPPSITTTPTSGSGWDTPDLCSIYQRSGWVQVNFNASRTTSGAGYDTVGAAATVVVEVPIGYRGNHNVWAQAWGQNGALNPTPCYYDRDTEEIKLGITVPSSGSIALTMTWPLEGAT